VEETVMKNWIGTAICAGLLVGCTSSEDRILFDGQFYKTSVRKVEKQLDVFTVTVKPVSKSLLGARQAGSHAAVEYCINQFGASDIIWTAGPDVPQAQLNIEKDVMTLQGQCPNAR
jgi:hypothetical protein